jgi:hypothetical protein
MLTNDQYRQRFRDDSTGMSQGFLTRKVGRVGCWNVIPRHTSTP